MERQKKVVDASVVIKWFLNEKKSEKVTELIKKHIKNEILIIVPELIFLEILNALRFKKEHQNRLHSVNKALQNAQFYIVNITFELINSAINISIEYDLTLYDALYASLAQIHECELITEDEKLKKFPSAVSL